MGGDAGGASYPRRFIVSRAITTRWAVEWLLSGRLGCNVAARREAHRGTGHQPAAVPEPDC
jgi:hypothetical protein